MYKFLCELNAMITVKDDNDVDSYHDSVDTKGICLTHFLQFSFLKFLYIFFFSLLSVFLTIHFDDPFGENR